MNKLSNPKVGDVVVINLGDDLCYGLLGEIIGVAYNFLNDLEYYVKYLDTKTISGWWFTSRTFEVIDTIDEPTPAIKDEYNKPSYHCNYYPNRCCAGQFPLGSSQCFYEGQCPDKGKIATGKEIDEHFAKHYSITTSNMYTKKQYDELKYNIMSLINDDSYACTFQTMGQYRSALIKEIDKL